MLVFTSTFSFGQHPNMNRHFFRHQIDISKYVAIDSLVLERIYIHSPFDYESDKVISTGYGDYLIEAPYKDKMIIKTTADRSKAIVLYNSFCFGRHKEFTVKETDRRIVLYYISDNEDEELYCGYIYDKKYKVCKYFEEINEEILNRRISKHLGM